LADGVSRLEWVSELAGSFTPRMAPIEHTIRCAAS
jgi:hypothetical protein